MKTLFADAPADQRPGDPESTNRGRTWLPVALLAISAFLAGCSTTEKLGTNSLVPQQYSHVAFSPDGKYVAAGAAHCPQGPHITIFDTATRKELWHFNPREVRHTSGALVGGTALSVEEVSYTPDNRILAAFFVTQGSPGSPSYNYTRQIALWDVSNCAVLGVIDEPKHYGSMAISPDGSHAALEGANNSIVIRGLTNGVFDKQLQLGSKRAEWLGFSPNSRCVTAVDRSNVIWVWDLQTGELLHSIQAPKGQGSFIHLAISPDGKRLATYGKDTRLWAWDSPEQMEAIKNPHMPVTSRIGAGMVFLLCLSGGNPLYGMGGLVIPRQTVAAAFSPDGKYLGVINFDLKSLGAVVGQPQTEVRVIEVETGRQVFIAKHNMMRSIAFSPDGNRVAAAGYGLEVWDWRSATPK